MVYDKRGVEMGVGGRKVVVDGGGMGEEVDGGEGVVDGLGGDVE